MSSDPVERRCDPVELWVHHELSEGRVITLRARGRSMYPWLRDGDRVSIRPLSAEGLRLGMVVMFWSPHAPVDERLSPLHRVLWYNARWVWIKGDSLPRFDEPKARKELLGEAFTLTRASGHEEARGLRGWVCFGGGWPIATLLSLGLGLMVWLRHWVRARSGGR